MATFLNYSQEIGILVSQASTTITGSFELTVLMGLTLLVALAFMFRLPIEAILIFTFPFIIVLLAFDSWFLLIGGIMIILSAIIIVRQFFLN